jgi:uncharacterized protein (TIGR02186 family)
MLAGPASAESLVSTLSDDAVEITSSFTGERIVVFGAIRGAAEDGAGYDVAVVVEGPRQDVIVRRKERVLGIWANRTARRFAEVPSYYVMHASDGFGERFGAEELRQFRLGVESLRFVQASAAEATAERFAAALVALRSERGLYSEREGEVLFLAPEVFRTTFFVPSYVPTGDYRVSVYLFRDGAFLAGETQTLSVLKGGLSARIARASVELPLLYGLAAAALALFSGWLAGLIFRRP